MRKSMSIIAPISPQVWDGTWAAHPILLLTPEFEEFHTFSILEHSGCSEEDINRSRKY